MTPDEAALRRLAKSRHGVMTTDLLHACGYSRTMIQRRVGSGAWTREHRGVFSLWPPSQLGRFRAAVDACGADAALSHRSAAALHGLLTDARGVIDVTVPVAGRPKRNVVIHSAPDITGCTTAWRSIPVTTVARTIYDLSTVATRDELDRAMCEAQVLGVLRLSAIEDMVSSSQAHKGVAMLRELLTAHQVVVILRSEFERLFFDACRTRLIDLPLANHPIPCAGRTLNVDFVWPSERVIVECDSVRFHGFPARVESDRHRTVDLELDGWSVIRITWRLFQTQPDKVFALVARKRAAAVLRAQSPPFRMALDFEVSL